MNLDESAVNALVKQLQALGFKLDQSQKAATFISEPSAFTRNFAENLTPLEASIEYLLLHTPEVDLPERFMPANNSSNSFIIDVHSGSGDLKRRWFEESMAKEGGWPLHLVKEEHASTSSGTYHPENLVFRLGMRLLGKTESDLVEGPALSDIDPVEVDAYGGTVSPGRLLIPLPISPFTLHIFTPEKTPLLSPPAIHISSPSVPAYVRLHILSCVLRAVNEGRLMEAGETFVGACLRTIEEEWITIEDNGLPDIAQVLKHIAPRKSPETDGGMSGEELYVKPGRQKERPRKVDDRTDRQVATEFERLCTSKRYQEILATRKRLPAFSVRENFLSVLEKNKVVVVVGETGNVPSRCKTNPFTDITRIWKNHPT